MKVTVVHLRDPDSDCYIRVFVDGAEVESFDLNLFDVDPGRGYTREEWEASREADLARVHGQPAVWLAVRDAYYSASESEYVED